MKFMNEDQVQTEINLLQVVKRLLPYFLNQKKLFAASIFSILAMNFLSRMQPQLIGHAITNGIEKNDLFYVKQVAYIYLFVQFINLLVQFFQYYWVQQLGNKVLYDIRHDLIHHMQKLSITYFNKTPTGRIVTRITNDTSQLADMFHDGLIEIFVNVIKLIFIIAAIAWISPIVALIVVSLSPIYIYLNFKVSEKVRENLRESKKKMSQLNSFVAENIHGMKIVNLYNLKEKNRQFFSKISAEYRDLNLKSTHYYGLMHPIMNMFNGILFAVVLYYGGKATSLNLIEIGSFVALFMHVQDFIQPMREILEKYQSFQNSITSAERIFQLLDEKDEHLEHETNHISSPIMGNIKVKNLNFKYEPQLPFVLKNMNLEIKPGESIAVIGRTGSGKSTFISLLQKFYEAPHNTIFIDDFDISTIQKNSLRKQINIVQQDPFIFKGTLLSNITMNNEEITFDQALEAAGKVGLLDHLAKTSRNMTSLIEEKGANLSVGEKQLLAFARIIAYNPNVIILDEATANIDSQTEDSLQKATIEVTKNRTSIIVAHRLSTIKHCKRIIEFHNGEIKEHSPESFNYSHSLMLEPN